MDQPDGKREGQRTEPSASSGEVIGGRLSQVTL